jgi:hypothetical protein
MRRARATIVRLAAAGALGFQPAPALATVPIMAATILVTIGAVSAPPARADNLWLHACSFYSNTAPAFKTPPSGFSTNGSASTWQGSDSCATDPTQEGSLQIDTESGTGTNKYGLWQTISPYGINIDSAWTPGCSGYCDRQSRGPLVSCGLAQDHYEAYFQWNWGGSSAQQQRIYNNDGGRCTYSNGIANGTPINRSFPPTHEFGWAASCENGGSQCPALGSTLYVRGVQVGATETSTPSLLALGSNNLYYENGRYVRSNGWTISLAASDPSGVCSMGMWLNGAWIQGPTATPNQAYWDQCDPSAESNDPSPQDWTNAPTINTGNYPDGTKLQLAYEAVNAAGLTSTSPTSTSYVDNSPVALALAGAHSAPVTAGVQYLSATATAGASGVGEIKCSTDGGPWIAEQLSDAGTQLVTARVPVSGLGPHTVKCVASNQAIDPAGAPAASPVQKWTLNIGEPVGAEITFGKLGHRHCRRERKRVHKRLKWVLRCSRPPHTRLVARVPFGHRATVRGWFATVDGVALSHVRVAIRTAVDNGTHTWRTAAVVTTRADGSWAVRLRRGPSRLVEAVYGGGPLTVPTTSPTAYLLVPAKIILTSVPQHVPWGGTITIRGRVLGGFILRGEQILQLRSGVGARLQVVGNPRIGHDGRFHINLQAQGSGGVLRTAIAISTLQETNYPFARGWSRRFWITIG